jgi:hypothetical protein
MLPACHSYVQRLQQRVTAVVIEMVTLSSLSDVHTWWHVLHAAQRWWATCIELC